MGIEIVCILGLSPDITYFNFLSLALSAPHLYKQSITAVRQHHLFACLPHLPYYHEPDVLRLV